jgi:hypothetical protein
METNQNILSEHNKQQNFNQLQATNLTENGQAR